MSIQGRDKEILCDRLICNHKLKYLPSERKKPHNIYRFWGQENKSDRSCLNVHVMMPLDNLFPVSAQGW